MAFLRSIKGHTLALPPVPRLNVGEAAGNEVPVTKGFGLAPVHFRLQQWEGGHFLEDAASGLGTLVNGKPVSWVPLRHGDLISAGSLQLYYLKDESPLPEFPEMGRTAPVTLPEEDSSAPAGSDPVLNHGQSRSGPEPPPWLPPEALEPVVPVRHWTAGVPPPGPPPRGWGRWGVALLVIAALAGAAIYVFSRNPSWLSRIRGGAGTHGQP